MQRLPNTYGAAMPQMAEQARTITAEYLRKSL